MAWVTLKLVGLSLTSRLFCKPLERPILLTVVIRSLTWAAAPLTTTWKLPVVVSGGLAASLAVQLTVVVPIANVLPEAGVQLTVGVADASSGSLAVAV